MARAFMALVLGMGMALGTGWAAENDTALPKLRGHWLPLPGDLTTEQLGLAQSILEEAEPRIAELHKKLTHTMNELRELSVVTDTQDDYLTMLGTRLINTRDTMLKELQALSARMQQEAGFTPDWGITQRGCSLWEVD